MSELIVIDPATGEEEELVATGAAEELAQLAEEWNAERVSEGTEPTCYRIQAAA